MEDIKKRTQLIFGTSEPSARTGRKERADLPPHVAIALALAEQGDAEAQNELAIIYERGDGVRKSLKKAVYWYGRSAALGLSVAQFNLAVLYDTGKGVAKDLQEAFRLYMLAAEQGLPEAQFCVGFSYELGEGVEQNCKEAARWYTLAAQQGEAEAQLRLGFLYECGDGMEVDHEQAFLLYMLAAEQGHGMAQCLVGLTYHYGSVRKQDYSLAVHWYTLAAEQGVEEAYNGLADVLLQLQRPEEALPWAEKAVTAFPGYSDVAFTMGSVYEELGRYSEALSQYSRCLNLRLSDNRNAVSVYRVHNRIARILALCPGKHTDR